MGWIVFATGMLILAGSVWYAVEATRFLAGTESAEGEIIEHEFSHGLSTGFREVGWSSGTEVVDMYAPIVAFRTSVGANIRFRANWSEGDPHLYVTRRSFPKMPASPELPSSTAGPAFSLSLGLSSPVPVA